jgi:hypothetical protein
MKPQHLRFDNTNNAALSLRILAEQVRSGETSVRKAEVGAGGVLNLEIVSNEREKRNA